jgi:hypothetical protein
MSFEAILEEVTQLQNVRTRLEELAEHNSLMAEALMQTAASIHRTTL